MGQRTVLIFGLVLAVVLLLLFSGAFERAGPKAGDGGNQTTEGAVELEGFGHETADDGAAPQRRVDLVSERASGPVRRFVVNGRVTLPDGSPADGATVRAKAVLLSYEESELAPETKTTADGTYELDVSTLFQVDDELLVGLAVDAKHPQHLPSEARVDVNGRDRLGPGRAYDLDLALGRGAVVTGRLIREDGSPVKNGWARMLRLVNGVVMQPEGMQISIPTDADGGFRIAHPEDDVEFVLFGNAPNLAPACRTVRIHMDRTTEVEPLVLPAGFSVTGWLRVRGEALPGMVIRASRYWKGATSTVFIGRDPGEVAWTDGVVSAQARTAMTDHDGRFELTGLSAGEHQVRLSHQGHVGVHWDLVREHVKPTVNVPAHDVVIDLDGVWLTLRVENEAKEPLRRVSVGFGGQHISTDEDGVLRMLLPPNGSVKASTRERNGYAGQTLSIETTAAGADQERTVTLMRVAPTRSLTFALEGDGAEHVDLVGLGVFNPDTRRNPKTAATLTRKKGVFTWRNAMPGTWDLEVRADGPWRGGTGLFLPAIQRVEIPALGTQHVVVKIVVGGRLRLDVKAPDGRPTHAKCKITDASGHPVDVFFSGRNTYSGMGSRGRLSGLGVSSVSPALPAGTYRVRLTQRGLQDLELTAEIVTGETTTLRATMLRAK